MYYLKTNSHHVQSDIFQEKKNPDSDQINFLCGPIADTFFAVQSVEMIWFVWYDIMLFIDEGEFIFVTGCVW